VLIGFYEIDPTAKCCKTLYASYLQLFIISYSVCPFQAFPVKNKFLLLSGAPQRCFNRVDSGLTNIVSCQSILLGAFVNYSRKKFYGFDTYGQFYKHFMCVNYRPLQNNSSLYFYNRKLRALNVYVIDTCGQCYKTFYGRKFRIFVMS